MEKGSGTRRPFTHSLQTLFSSGSGCSHPPWFPGQSGLLLTTTCLSHLPELPRAIIDLALGGILSCSYYVCHPASLGETNLTCHGNSPSAFPGPFSYLASQIIGSGRGQIPSSQLAVAGSQSLVAKPGGRRHAQKLGKDRKVGEQETSRRYALPSLDWLPSAPGAQPSAPPPSTLPPWDHSRVSFTWFSSGPVLWILLKRGSYCSQGGRLRQHVAL